MNTLIQAQQAVEVAEAQAVAPSQELDAILRSVGIDRGSLTVTVPGKVFLTTLKPGGLIGLTEQPPSPNIFPLTGNETV